jgi:hypothetical protein
MVYAFTNPVLDEGLDLLSGCDCPQRLTLFVYIIWKAEPDYWLF